MINVLEYIEQNYTLFLGAGILILLAVIGYYADKTNFGQGKNANNNEKKQRDLSHIRLSEVTGEKNFKTDENQVDNNLDVHQPDGQEVILNELPQNAAPDLNNVNNEQVEVGNNVNSEIINTDVEENVQTAVPSEIVISNVNSVEINANSLNSVSVEKVNDTPSESLLNEDSFSKFNEEFNLLVPERELISTDLLNDIDDLELGKTQKLDLSEIPALEDIELPKIKNLSKEEQDIWKF